jgi:hypothetical protein
MLTLIQCFITALGMLAVAVFDLTAYYAFFTMDLLYTEEK